MTISTRDQLIDSLGNNASRFVVDKSTVTNTASGQIFSLWRATGQPGQGAIPGAAALANSATTGAIGFPNQTAPATSYLGWVAMQVGNSASTVEIHDRIAHMGGLSGTVTTSQTVNLDLHSSGLNPPAARIGDSNFSDIQWWLEVYTDMGATASTATINVTYNDGTSGDLTGMNVGGTLRAGRMLNLNAMIPAAAAGKYIRDINSVTLSVSTGTAGNFGFTATRLRAVLPLMLGNRSEIFDWAQLGLPEVPNDTCLSLAVLCSTTSTGSVRGSGKIAHG